MGRPKRFAERVSVRRNNADRKLPERKKTSGYLRSVIDERDVRAIRRVAYSQPVPLTVTQWRRLRPAWWVRDVIFYRSFLSVVD